MTGKILKITERSQLNILISKSDTYENLDFQFTGKYINHLKELLNTPFGYQLLLVDNQNKFIG